MDEIKYLKRHAEELKYTKASITPICIVVDTSMSMILFKQDGVSRMERLNEGIQQFLNEIKKDDMLVDSVEIAVVTFENNAEVFQNFSTIENIEQIYIEAKRGSGDTPKGVELALKVLEDEKNFLKSNRSKYNQPWIVIFSDGRATPSGDTRDENGKKDYRDINRRLRTVQNKVKEMESNNKLTVIPVLISEKSDHQYKEAISQMRGFSSKDRVLVLGNDEDSLSFKDFFKILSRSVSVSNADLLFRKDIAVDINQNLRQNQDSKINFDNAVYQDNSNSNTINELIKQRKNKIHKNISVEVLLDQPLKLNQNLKITYTVEGMNPVQLDIKSQSEDEKASFDIYEEFDKLHICIELETDEKVTILYNDYCDIVQNKILIDLRKAIELNKMQSNVSKESIEKQNIEQYNSFVIDKTEDNATQNEIDKSNNTSNDEYLNSLLEGLTDWDNF